MKTLIKGQRHLRVMRRPDLFADGWKRCSGIARTVRHHDLRPPPQPVVAIGFATHRADAFQRNTSCFRSRLPRRVACRIGNLRRLLLRANLSKGGDAELRS